MLSSSPDEKALLQFLKFVEKVCLVFAPKTVVIDKCLSELNALSQFKSNIAVILCWFHVKQALERWFVKNIANEHHAIVLSSFPKLHYCTKVDDFEDLASCLLRYAKSVALKPQHVAYAPGDEECNSFEDYLTTYWFSDPWKQTWSLAFFARVGDITMSFTNNFLESWHRILKSTALGDTANRRVDTLVRVLVVDMRTLLHQRICSQRAHVSHSGQLSAREKCD
jgi:hypothetical protein